MRRNTDIHSIRAVACVRTIQCFSVSAEPAGPIIVSGGKECVKLHPGKELRIIRCRNVENLKTVTIAINEVANGELTATLKDRYK